MTPAVVTLQEVLRHHRTLSRRGREFYESLLAYGDVLAVREFLASRLGTRDDKIRVLTASRSGCDSQIDLATRANIVKELLFLGDQASEGEQILFHYSGHGVRNEYTVLPGLESDGKDEAIVPTDAGYSDPAEFYLLDKELGWLLGRVTDKGAFVTVLMDCFTCKDNISHATGM